MSYIRIKYESQERKLWLYPVSEHFVCYMTNNQDQYPEYAFTVIQKEAWTNLNPFNYQQFQSNFRGYNNRGFADGIEAALFFILTRMTPKPVPGKMEPLDINDLIGLMKGMGQLFAKNEQYEKEIETLKIQLKHK